MEKELLEKSFYSVTYEDIQTVATDELGRELTEQEIESVVDRISDRIDWYEPVSYVLSEHFEPVTNFDNDIEEEYEE